VDAEARDRTEDVSGAAGNPSLRALVGYFLRLGAYGFGGPIALVGYMHRDLVKTRA
jgi:chromate transporter